jgi:hypothetical protein
MEMKATMETMKTNGCRMPATDVKTDLAECSLRDIGEVKLENDDNTVAVDGVNVGH